MDFISTAALIIGGYYLNNNDKLMKKAKPEPIKPVDQLPDIRLLQDTPSDKWKLGKVFGVHFYKNKATENKNYDPKYFWHDLDQETVNRVKSRVNLEKKDPLHPDLNDVGFSEVNRDSNLNNYESLPSIDDIDRDVQLIHNNMVPFFGSTVKQFTEAENANAAHRLELFTGNFKLRQDNKHEVEALFDPTPNNGLPFGSTEVTNRDKSRFHPSATGKKHNELPFEQIRVGKGIGHGYTARPSGGYHQDVRILPKTTDELNVNPKFSYEGRILPGKALTENPKLIGQQIIKKPKSILWNWFGERNFTTTGVHKKNRQRETTILKCTNRQDLHREYKGGAAPVHKSQNTPDSLRGQKRLSHKRNFLNTPHRNLTQVTGKKHNDYGLSGFWNKPTERSQTGSRVHYTNVHHPVSRGQQYFNDGMKYTRKMDLIHQKRPEGNAGPAWATKGPVYDQNNIARTTIRETTEDAAADDYGQVSTTTYRGPVYDQNDVAKTTIRETMEDNLHDGFVGQFRHVGKVYDQNDTPRTTIRETTEDNRHHGYLDASHERRGPVYDQNNLARTTIRETTEDNRHHGYLDASHERRGPVYDQNDLAKTTIRETTEDNRHHGYMNPAHERKGRVYDQNEIARTTIRETTEDNRHHGHMNPAHERKGRVYDQNDVAKTTIRETTEDNLHQGYVGQFKHTGKVYDQNEIAKTTIRETTEDNRYIPGANRGVLMNGKGYQTTKMEIKNPQKAYLCNNEYTGIAGAAGKEKARVYQSVYNVNDNKEKIARGRAPGEVKNAVPAGKEAINLYINKLDADRMVPHTLPKSSSIGNIYNPYSVNFTSRKNVTPRHVDRLQVETLDQLKMNPLFINQNLN